MESLHQSTPAEHVTLQMENELLAHEVAHLRARLAAAGGERGAGEALAEEAQAYKDVRWLVRRLETSVAAPVLQRFDGFRVLQERYGRTDS